MDAVLFVAIVVAICIVLSRLASILNRKMTDEAMDAFDSISTYINNRKNDKHRKGR